LLLLCLWRNFRVSYWSIDSGSTWQVLRQYTAINFFRPLFELRVQPILSLTSVLSNGHKSRSVFWYNIRLCPHHSSLISIFVLEFCFWTLLTYVLTSAVQYMKQLLDSDSGGLNSVSVWSHLAFVADSVH
jgi:hypothetical protein